MKETSEFDMVSENLIRAFIQFKKLRMTDSNLKPNKTHQCLKHSEVMILFELMDAETKYPEGASVSYISQSLRVKPPSITPVITSLEKKNMLERTMDSNDRRIIRVKLTETGRKYIYENKEHTITKIKGLVTYLGIEKSITLANLINDVFLYFYNQGSKQ